MSGFAVAVAVGFRGRIRLGPESQDDVLQITATYPLTTCAVKRSIMFGSDSTLESEYN
jgi:hypothetical protein